MTISDTIPATGWAAAAADAPLAPIDFRRRAPREDDIVIDIDWCGVCHSDVHTVRNEWHGTEYPCLPGHEIIGRVREVGAAVTRAAPGDIVGVGCLVHACLQCPTCERDLEQYCAQGATQTYNWPDADFDHRTFGGYSSTIVVHEHFVLRIPDTLEPAAAAPLLCAGITTWSPLRRFGVGPGTRVGVAGFGGLGLMAIKLAAALGAEVTAITRSPEKAERARAAGAHHVILASDKEALRGATMSLDLIIDTIPVHHPLNPLLRLLSLEGNLVLVGAIEPFDEPLDARQLYLRRTITASAIGGLAETQELLDFCGQRGIVADIEKISIDQINAAYDEIAAGRIDFRYVIDMASLTPTAAT